MQQTLQPLSQDLSQHTQYLIPKQSSHLGCFCRFGGIHSHQSHALQLHLVDIYHVLKDVQLQRELG